MKRFLQEKSNIILRVEIKLKLYFPRSKNEARIHLSGMGRRLNIPLRSENEAKCIIFQV